MEILAAGSVASVQDLGRTNFRAMGVGEAGAMDRLSLQVANLLAGNSPDSACIETAISPLRVRFNCRTRFAVAGAPARVLLDDASLPSFWSAIAEAGQTLDLAPSPVGMWTYLAVAGGIDVPPVLGSRSTDLKGGYGGHQGRALLVGDRLDTPSVPVRAMHPDHLASFGVEPPPGWKADSSAVAVRAIPAREHACFGAEAQFAFWNAAWTVQPDSNRIGYRLTGPTLEPLEPLDLLSYGLIPGTVQVPPIGQPVVQLSEANTCGGYPKMAVVVGADLRLLAQVRPGRAVRFIQATRADGLCAILEDRAYLAQIERNLRRRMSREDAA